jgi:Domain of unknown function (DUF4129)
MRGSAARALVPALLVLGLVGVVAIAATGSTPSGTGESRPPADIVLDTIVSLAMVLLIPGALILAYGLMQRKEVAKEAAKLRRGRWLGFAVLMGIFLVVTYFRLRDWERAPFVDETDDLGFPELGEPEEATPTNTGTRTVNDPEFALVPVLVILGLAGIAVAAYFVYRRKTAPVREDAVLAAELEAALDDSLDALRAEPDPRRAVIAAYARLERVLAANWLSRAESETPNEYLARILEALEVEQRSVRRLTDLFTEAKFSSHAVDAAMKDEAIEALSTVRDELRARREAEREALLAARAARPKAEAAGGDA